MLRRLAFNLWYFRSPPWDSGVSPPELLVFIREHPPGRALDVGCGSGTNAITLAKAGWQVVGVDFARRAIQLARKKARKYGVQVDFRLEDASQLKGINGKFDLILDIGCFHGLSAAERARYRRNLERLLAEGGHFLMYTFIRQPHENTIGVTEEDLHLLEQHLLLVKRQDGTERGERPSAWLHFKRK